MRPYPHLPRPLLIAHRGASANAPENTLEAFEYAVRVGADVLELDVHLTADDEIVVHHDATVERTTNGTGSIAAMTLHRVRELDAGYRFASPSGSHVFRERGLKIPLLAEVLASFPTTAMNIEVKHAPRTMIPRLLSLLTDRKPEQHVLASGSDEVMKQLEAAKPRFPLSLARDQCLRAVAWSQVGRMPADLVGRTLQVPPVYWGVPIITRRFITVAHRYEMDVHLWTLDDPKAVRAWVHRGADGIITNDPGAMLDVLPGRLSRGRRRSTPWVTTGA